ncbi:acyltransferase [Tenacibaculum sp. 47A_GOM-205m]|uniref:acyltransferase family protein n=1 Tax=Tenacibaculum sp. 47A_GOM-205m TaxID=1380384 RepID=UPI0004AD7F61|nr:acyltransferase [Tenacibaculum sp. 47A_GOM-205m]
MSITLRESNHLKSIAILMMLCLHLFNRDYQGIFNPLIFIGKQPLSYYISLFSDACVPIFAFVSGYGLFYKYQQNKNDYLKGNYIRLKKLYINYWVVLVLFAVFLGFLLNKDGYPGDFYKVILNVTGLETSYNGAWWFFTIYVFFALTSKFWFSLLNKLNAYWYFFFLAAIYVLAFYFRIYKTDIFDNPYLKWMHVKAALYFCTLLQFMLGAYAFKFNWDSKVDKLFNKLNYKEIVACLVILLIFILHALIPNLIIAPFTALVFIFMFLQIKQPRFNYKILDFFTPHATNFWLIHMFFYSIFFSNLIYSFKYPIIIFFTLLIVCLLGSFIINFVISKINRII